MYHIYTLSDPGTQEVRYVGLSQNAHKRLAMHLLNPGKQDSPKNQWVQELLKDGTAPILSIIETPETRKEAEDREAYWIQYYLKSHAPLFNISKNRLITPPNTKQKLPGNLMEDELRQLLKEHGWSLHIRTNKSGKYFYALKWMKKQVYIASQSKLSRVTKEEVLRKINAA